EANSAAARIGPTVCELEGPIPILNRSNTLIAMPVPRLHLQGCLGTSRVPCQRILPIRPQRNLSVSDPKMYRSTALAPRNRGSCIPCRGEFIGFVCVSGC